MIKSYIKKTALWKKISRSNLYQSLRFPEVYRKQQEEPNFYKRFLKMHPSKNDLIFDVGANMGHKSVIFSRLSKKVVSFEPSEKLYLYLKERFKNTNVAVYNCALGSVNTETELYIVENNEAYNSLNKKHFETTTASRGIATINTVKHQKIKVRILEDFIKNHGVPKYIKIDVEGYEYEVIKGLKTPVDLLSFEANLPEFCEESVQIVTYLDSISGGQYRYNFSNNHSFLLKDFIDKGNAIFFLKNTGLDYLEVYVILNHD